jgi:hypothetical protein
MNLEATMSDPSKAEESFVAKSASGTADEEQLNISIADAWRAALTDSKERAEIAALLGVQESELDPDNPPFRAVVEGAGVFGADILILLAVSFGVGFAKEFGKRLGSQAAKMAAGALRGLWTDHMRNRVSPPGSGRLGPEKEDVEER